MCTFFAWLESNSDLTLGQLANVETVGIGLYLALGIIQGISTTGVAGLARRVDTLRKAVIGARMTGELASIRTLSGKVSGLEIGFHNLNRWLLRFVFALFLVSVCWFAYDTFAQNSTPTRLGEWLVIFYYLSLPFIIFVVAVTIVWSRCKSVAVSVRESEKRIKDALL